MSEEPLEDHCESAEPSLAKFIGKAAVPLAVGSLAAGCQSRSEIIMPEAPPACDDPSGVCGPVSTEFQRTNDQELRTRFLRMDESTLMDWMLIGISSSTITRMNTTKAIVNLLQQCRQYQLGFPINTLEHCLQTATRAINDNASDEMVLAGLLHDVGIAFSYSGHAQISASILRPVVSNSVYQMVMHHHEFELAHYGHLIGEPTDLRSLYETEAWYDLAANFVDNWVQVSYDPGFPSLPLEEFIPLIEEKFAGFSPADLRTTMKDCFIETTP